MNNNFHIRSLIGEEATCWHISENMVSVNWDSGVTEHLWKKDLDKMVACNGWEYIVKGGSSPKDKLPNKFKVSYRDGPVVMSIIVPCNGDYIVAIDEDGDVYTWWTVQDMGKFIAEGVWKVLPEEKKEDFTRQCIDKLVMCAGCMSYNDSYFGEPSGELKQVIRQLDKTYNPEKIDVGTLSFKIEMDGLQEAQAIVSDLVNQSNTLLESVKSFTSGTGHDVFISEGIYKVYRKDEDMPYICYSDEQVLAVMDALKTLDEAGKEGEGRFFTLNLEGIL